MNAKRASRVILSITALVFAALSCNYFGQSGESSQYDQSAAATLTALFSDAGTGLAPGDVQSETATPVAGAPAGEATTPGVADQPVASTAESLPTPVAGPSCAEETCLLEGIFLPGRPIGADGRNYIDVSNHFGEYQRSKQDANRGSYFLNSTGTRVLAAAPGVVVAAGDDEKNNYGVRRGFLGNLVILRHELPGIDQPIFTLYAHLKKVWVSVDQQVGAGETIGRVGSSGSVRGSTLYFEVRYGENAYANVRNPELWLPPLDPNDYPANGILAGRILDGDGKLVQVDNLVLTPLDGPGSPERPIYITTYTNTNLAGQPPYQENFAVGDLPPGRYKFSIWRDTMQQRIIEIQPGMITFINFILE
jgi:murein DD-endopeptidase MepM/ murein hydrolase activator NlpD